MESEKWTLSAKYFKKMSVLDEFTHDNSEIDHILVSSYSSYALSPDAFKNMYSDHRAIPIRITQEVSTMDGWTSMSQKGLFFCWIRMPSRSFCGSLAFLRYLYFRTVHVPLLGHFSEMTYKMGRMTVLPSVNNSVFSYPLPYYVADWVESLKNDTRQWCAMSRSVPDFAISSQVALWGRASWNIEIDSQPTVLIWLSWNLVGCY